MKTEKHGDSEALQALLVKLMLVCVTTLSNIVWLSSGVPFKLASMQVDLNGNVICVFGHVLWAGGIVLLVSFTRPSPLLQSSPAHL